MLLLHGMANNGKVWDPLTALAPHRAALRSAELWSAELPWRAGGLIEWSHLTTPTDWLAQALDTAVAEAGRINFVVAHSYSATVLLDLLCRDAQLLTDISGVLFVAPFYRRSPQEFRWDTIAGLVDKFVLTMQEGIRVIAGTRGNPDLHRAMAERVCEEIGPYGWARFFELYLRTPWMRTDLLRVPAMVLSGADDMIAAPAESRALAAALPTATLREFTACGHFPMLEQAEHFADLVDEFCATDAVLELNQ